MTWDKAKIIQALQTNNKVVERAILAIYNLQTLDEQNSSETKHHNGVGFSGAHARLGTYYAKWIKSGNNLTGKHLEKARNIALHYVGQLETLAKEKDSQAA